MVSSTATKDDKLTDAMARLHELHTEAITKRLSCKVMVEVTYQNGIPQQVQDERRRYSGR